MALIDLDISGLKQSTQSRTGTPDGNIYFNPNGTLEIITVEELATVNGSTNVISNADGITMRALYAFERQERRTDENLRELDPFIKGSFKRAGAYAFIYGRTLSQAGVGAPLTDDRKKVRNSGWVEYTDAGSTISKIYFGTRASGAVNVGSQAYYQHAAESTSTDFAFSGFLNEAVKVYDSTGPVDNTSYFAASLRTWGQVHDRKNIAEGGFTDAHGYSASLGIGERLHPYNTGFNESDVHTGTVIAPWNNMVFSSLDTARTETGLVGTGTFNFSFQITNSGNGSLSQIVAKADAWARDSADIDAHATNTWVGKDKETLYTLTPDGKVRFMQGLFPENIPVNDQKNVILVTDTGNEVTYESVAGGTIYVGDAAAADANAWYHMFYASPPDAAANDFNTLSAITVNDASGEPIKGLVGGLTSIPFDFAYDTNTQGGFSTQTDRPVIIEVEGDGGCTSAKTAATITNSTALSFTCAPDTETNV